MFKLMPLTATRPNSPSARLRHFCTSLKRHITKAPFYVNGCMSSIYTDAIHIFTEPFSRYLILVFEIWDTLATLNTTAVI